MAFKTGPVLIYFQDNRDKIKRNVALVNCVLSGQRDYAITAACSGIRNTGEDLEKELDFLWKDWLVGELSRKGNLKI